MDIEGYQGWVGRGGLITEDWRERIHDAARRVTRVPGSASFWDAPSAASAAGWLLTIAETNALRPEAARVSLPELGGRSLLIGYRGQIARYQALIPSRYRLSEPERRVHDAATTWFIAAIGALHARAFRYLRGNVTPELDYEAGLCAAQHYGLGTFLIDWTWDPLIAMAFAVAGGGPDEGGVVLVRTFGHGDVGDHNVLLPPTFLERPWAQRGFFSWHPVPPEYLGSSETRSIAGDLPAARISVGNYVQVRFPITPEERRWGERVTAGLLEDPLHLGKVAAWAQSVARAGHRYRFDACCADVRSLTRECSRAGVRPPEQVLTAQAYSENVKLQLDYVDSACLRFSPYEQGRLVYDERALGTILAGMPWGACLLGGCAGIRDVDARAALFEQRGFAMRLGGKLQAERMLGRIAGADGAQLPARTFLVAAQGTQPNDGD